MVVLLSQAQSELPLFIEICKVMTFEYVSTRNVQGLTKFIFLENSAFPSWADSMIKCHYLVVAYNTIT